MIDLRKWLAVAQSVVDGWWWSASGDAGKLVDDVEKALVDAYREGFEAGRAQGRAEAASESEGQS